MKMISKFDFEQPIHQLFFQSGIETTSTSEKQAEPKTPETQAQRESREKQEALAEAEIKEAATISNNMHAVDDVIHAQATEELPAFAEAYSREEITGEQFSEAIDASEQKESWLAQKLAMLKTDFLNVSTILKRLVGWNQEPPTNVTSNPASESTDRVDFFRQKWISEKKTYPKTPAFNYDGMNPKFIRRKASSTNSAATSRG